MFRFIKIWFYQRIANSFMRKLEKTKNKEQWQLTYKKAMEFNDFCVKQEIYLK